jgi:hypothetical protein
VYLYPEETRAAHPTRVDTTGERSSDSGERPILATVIARDIERPFRDSDAREIEAAGREAYERRDLGMLREAVSELSLFRSSASAADVLERLKPLLTDLESRADGGVMQGRHHGHRKTEERAEFHRGPCSPGVMARIDAELAAIHDIAHEIYVGRTAFPERRLLQHLDSDGRDWLSILHWADSLEDAETMEQWVLERVRNSPKLAQQQLRRGGKFSRSFHAIYVSWTRDVLRQEPDGPQFRVAELPGDRRWPSRAAEFGVEHLRSASSRAQAAAALRRFEERESRYLDERRALR